MAHRFPIIRSVERSFQSSVARLERACHVVHIVQSGVYIHELETSLLHECFEVRALFDPCAQSTVELRCDY